MGSNVYRLDVCIFEFGEHLLRIGDEIGAQITAVELHSLDDVELGFERLRLFDGDDTFMPTLFLASASIRPISVSPLAEMVPTCAISSFVETSWSVLECP
jgi:hypothetical protein